MGVCARLLQRILSPNNAFNSTTTTTLREGTLPRRRGERRQRRMRRGEKKIGGYYYRTVHSEKKRGFYEGKGEREPGGALTSLTVNYFNGPFFT